MDDTEQRTEDTQQQQQQQEGDIPHVPDINITKFGQARGGPALAPGGGAVGGLGGLAGVATDKMAQMTDKVVSAVKGAVTGDSRTGYENEPK